VATVSILNASSAVAARLGILFRQGGCARAALTSGAGQCACIAAVGRATKNGTEKTAKDSRFGVDCVLNLKIL